MDFNEVMKELEACGTAQNRKIYARHGAGEPMFGVSFANLERLRKKIKIDHGLAHQLWSTGNHDARVLATMITDPEQMTDKRTEEWAKGADNTVIVDLLARFLSNTTLARKKAEKWNSASNEWIGQAGWALIGLLAQNDATLPDDYFEQYLGIIARDIHKRKNRVRHAMNMTLIAIGTRNSRLEKEALAVAKKIGKVEVDHGETNCKTPDAAQYIAKTLAHRQKKKDKAARA